jgi:predicted deacylase
MSAPAVVRDPGEIDFSRPGKHHYQIAFHLDSGWGYSLVPMTVINGTAGSSSADTPGVVAFGGTHGNEYEGQVAMKRLCHELDPARMRGRVILIPQLSETACRAHQRCSAEDGVNMNRAFPGNPRGTVSYRISNFVKTRIFPMVRVVLDIHAGGREAVFPLCASFHPLPDPYQFAETAAVARLFDTPFLFVYSRQMASGLLTDEAEDEGKIALGGEFGHAEGCSTLGVRHAYEGVRNVLRHYGMLDGDIAHIDIERDAPPRMVQAPYLSDYIPAPRTGIWEPAVHPGADVCEGDLIGRLHDFSDHSSAPLEIRAHKTGVIIALYFAALCHKGLTLYVIGEDVNPAQ